MKRKLKTLTEQFTDARTNYNRILGRGDKGLITEQWTPGILVKLRTCTGGATFGGFCVPSSQLSPQIGDAIHITNYWVPNWNGRKAFITEIYGSCNAQQTTVVPWTGSCPNCCHSSWHGTQTSPQGACWATCGNTNPTPCTTYGCTDPTAMNYNATILPNCDQGCVYDGEIGCTDSTASNYDPAAIYDDGSCLVCDTTPNSPCAQQWFQNPNASWASTWITNRDCSNYTWPSTNLETQALSIMAGAPNPQPNVYNDWNDIWSAGQNSGLSPANAFIAKMAKAKYSQCQIQACNC